MAMGLFKSWTLLQVKTSLEFTHLNKNVFLLYKELECLLYAYYLV